MQQDHPATPNVMVGSAAVERTKDANKAAQYARLRKALEAAYDQAATGKGAERHADNHPFHEQPMQLAARLHGVGFITGQVSKKLSEAQGMMDRGEHDAAIREITGAIVYACGAFIYAEDKKHADES